MYTLRNISFIVLLFFFTSCTTDVKFPTSGVTPAADISAKKTADNNGNFKISITAKNLASADKLNPPQSFYIAWIITRNEGIQSIGRLKTRNAKTDAIDTLTPFAFTELFITAEGRADISYPSGVEISRVKFKN